MRIGLFNALWLPLGLLSAGCATAPHCDSLTQCGGDFLAGAVDLGGGVSATEWAASLPSDSCSDQASNQQESPSLSLIPARPAGVRAFEPSTVDWCGGLVIKNDGTVKAFDDGWYETLRKYGNWFPSVPLYTARLEIGANNQHTLETTQLVATQYELSPTCIYAQGVVMSCSKLGDEIHNYIVTKLSNVTNLSAVVYDSKCEDAAGGGCNCEYNLALTKTSSGPWASDNGKLNFFDATAAPPASTDYCVNGGELQLTGDRGTDLFNRVALKTLKLRPSSCSDGVISKATQETGIDCGGTCPNACP